MKTTSTALLLSLAATGAMAHMSIWTDSMYGVGEDFDTSAGDPVAPLGPDWDTQDEWWFRGPTARSLSPAARGSTAVTQLPAGGSVTFEIACNVAWTSMGCCEWQVDYYNSSLDACPGNSGAYHSGDPAADTIDDNLLSGCALGIADVDDINDVTLDNLAIFSVNHNCVKQKDTTFEVPAQMPACTGDKCICGWFWLANNGTANFYMTAFDCAVTGAAANAPKIGAPVDPQFCPDDDLAAGTCQRPVGAKRPLYAYNEPTNVEWQGNDARPGYHASWSFPNDGAQNDIFVTANVTSSVNATSSVASASGTATSAVVASTDVSSSVSTSSASSSAAVASSSAAAATTAAPASSSLSPAQQAAVAWTSRSLAAASSSSSKSAASASKAASSSSKAAASASSRSSALASSSSVAAAKSASSASAAFSRAAASALSSKSAASASASKASSKAAAEASKLASEASKSSSQAAAAASKAALKLKIAQVAGAKNADRIKLAKVATTTAAAAYSVHGGAAAAADAWSSKMAASSSAQASAASVSSRAEWRASAASKAVADRSSKRAAASSRSAADAAASEAAGQELAGSFKNTQNLKLAVLGSLVQDDDE